MAENYFCFPEKMKVITILLLATVAVAKPGTTLTNTMICTVHLFQNNYHCVKQIIRVIFFLLNYNHIVITEM